jgi:hypothetical protein
MFRLPNLVIIGLTFFITSCAPLQVRSTQTQVKNPLYDTVIFDIASVNTGTPSSEALEFFRSKIVQYGIGNRVIFRQRQDIPGPNVWTPGQLRQFEENNRLIRDKNAEDRILVVFIAYLPGIYLGGSSTTIAGIQYGDTSFAIFRDITDDDWEGVVLLHELGHMIRVAWSRDEPPSNPDRPHHCNDEDCTMFWRAGTHRTNFCIRCLGELRKLRN